MGQLLKVLLTDKHKPLKRTHLMLGQIVLIREVGKAVAVHHKYNHNPLFIMLRSNKCHSINAWLCVLTENHQVITANVKFSADKTWNT